MDLSARTFYKPETSSADYLNYGVGASEVNLIITYHFSRSLKRLNQ